MYLVIRLLHLSESLHENDIRYTACVYQDIVNQKSLDDTRYNHCIVVGIILELKILLEKMIGMWDHLDLMKGPCTHTCCTLLCASFFCLLLAGSKVEPPVIESTSFVAEGATTWLLCEAIVVVVEVSSPEVGANVGHLFSNANNQEQGNTIVNG
jgi:hypothetical protein